MASHLLRIRFNLRGRHRSHADDLNDHFFVFGAVEVMQPRGMQHEAAGPDRNGFLRRERVAFTRPPRAFDDRDESCLIVHVRARHLAGCEAATDDVDTRFGGIADDVQRSPREIESRFGLHPQALRIDERLDWRRRRLSRACDVASDDKNRSSDDDQAVRVHWQLTQGADASISRSGTRFSF